MKVKRILISQPKPEENSTSPYLNIGKNVTVDFRSFIHIEGLSKKQIREQKIDLGKHSAIIMTSKNAVDHFFRYSEESRYKVPDQLKFFCLSEAVALYLQKHIIYRKRKIYFGEKTIKDLLPYLKKHKEHYFLLPSSTRLSPSIEKTLNEAKLKWKRAALYETIVSDLSDLKDISYDILVFFSPFGIKSLVENFPDFKQNQIRIAVFGNATKKAAEEAGLKIEIKAPTKKYSSMSTALIKYIEEANKRKR